MVKASNGEKIKALRMAEGMRKEDLAKRLSLSDRAVRFIEAGERNPGEYTIKKVVGIFGVSMDYFNDTTIFLEELDNIRTFEEANE